ncbi:MAG: LexA family protein [Alphaproteobacteria bacterium]
MKLEIISPVINSSLKLPYYEVRVQAGFPSPADNYLENELDLNDYLIHRPASTFFIKATGNSMINAGIHQGDLLIVDRSITPKDGMIVIAHLNGEFTLKRLSINKEKITLVPENHEYKPIKITADMNFEIWGVVSNVIHKLI